MNLNDRFKRPLQDLRISVIDRCNFRCPYCMPEREYSKHYKFLKEKEWLNFDEINRLVKLFVRLGVRKVRLTGGEPLLRPQLNELIATLNKIDGVEDLALTTNGALLSEHAKKLKQAGLKRLTVSLDSLDTRVFKFMSGQKGSLQKILQGIKAAEDAGFDSMKINMMVQKGVNDQSILDLVKYFKDTPHVLRFIEYMDVGNCNHWESQYVLPSKEIVKIINAHFPIELIEANYFGEVAERYRFKDGQGEIGFISSVSQPFCGSCTRARLSTDGKLFTCLFASQGVDLKTPLREGASDQEILDLIGEVWQKREDRYSELRFEPKKPAIKILPKVEMFQIGG